MPKSQKHTAANTLSTLGAFDYFDKKYYGVSLEENEEKTWSILFNHVIDKCKFFEYLIGINLSDSTFDKLRERVSSLPDPIENDREVKFKEAYEELKRVGLEKNIAQFYSTKKYQLESLSYNHYIARLEIDDNLKNILASVKTMMDYENNLEINGLEIEFSDGVFYEDKNTALLFTDYSEFKAYILLSEDEKTKLEQQGIEFSDVKEREPITIPEDVMTLEEIKKIN